jgi:hypothetical protein
LGKGLPFERATTEEKNQSLENSVLYGSPSIGNDCAGPRVRPPVFQQLSIAESGRRWKTLSVQTYPERKVCAVSFSLAEQVEDCAQSLNAY